MNIINIETSSDNGISSFRITGSYEEIKKNNRLLTFLRRVRATSHHEAFYIPFIEELKISTLQGIQQALTRHNFEYKLSSELELDLKHYIREQEQFTEFSNEASLIRNNHFDDNDKISEKFTNFKKQLFNNRIS